MKQIEESTASDAVGEGLELAHPNSTTPRITQTITHLPIRHKLFISYLLVVFVGLLVLVISTLFVAPVNFSHYMQGMGRGAGQGGMMNQRMQAIDAEVDTAFRESMNTALLWAAAAATITAVGASWFVSQQIVNPIRALVALSQRIAGGHYEERLTAATPDEIGELIHSFNQMAQALAETESMRRQLLGDVTHELKTPLASIKGYIEGLQDGVIPATPETYQLIHREAARLQRLVQDLQELSRVEAGQESVHGQPVDLSRLLQTVITRMRPQFDEKTIRLHADLPDNLPPAYADLDRTEQIVTNLLGNALQYTPEGGDVSVRLTSLRDTLQIAVQDSGVGLAVDDLERVFQRFYRVDKSRSRASGGSGIGLTIARHLAEAQGGSIHAESAGIGQGSTFYLTLPTR